MITGWGRLGIFGRLTTCSGVFGGAGVRFVGGCCVGAMKLFLSTRKVGCLFSPPHLLNILGPKYKQRLPSTLSYAPSK